MARNPVEILPLEAPHAHEEWQPVGRIPEPVPAHRDPREWLAGLEASLMLGAGRGSAAAAGQPTAGAGTRWELLAGVHGAAELAQRIGEILAMPINEPWSEQPRVGRGAQPRSQAVGADVQMRDPGGACCCGDGARSVAAPPTKREVCP